MYNKTIKKGETNMENTSKTYEVWYKEEQFGPNRLWGVYHDELEAKWAEVNAKGKGYKHVCILTFEK